MPPKTYWSGVSTHGENSQRAIRSWFSPLCDDMTCEKAEILCDSETDKEKKIRATMVDKDGKRRIATRTLGKKTFNITLSAVQAA